MGAELVAPIGPHLIGSPPAIGLFNQNPLSLQGPSARCCSVVTSLVLCLLVPGSLMSASLPGNRDLPSSQYDLSTYWGRVRHAADLADPR